MEEAFGIIRFEIGKTSGRGRPPKYLLLKRLLVFERSSVKLTDWLYRILNGESRKSLKALQGLGFTEEISKIVSETQRRAKKRTPYRVAICLT